MKDGEFEVLVIAVTGRMLEACLEHKFLPPVIVHPKAAHVRDFLLFDGDIGRVAAVAYSSGWGWHCKQAMVRTARIEWMDEVIDGDGYNVDEMKMMASGSQLPSSAGPTMPNTIPLINCMAIYHHFGANVFPNHEQALESAIRNRRELMNHPLFNASIKKMQTEPLVRTFFLTYSDSIGLGLREPTPLPSSV